MTIDRTAVGTARSGCTFVSFIIVSGPTIVSGVPGTDSRLSRRCSVVATRFLRLRRLETALCSDFFAELIDPSIRRLTNMANFAT